MTNMGRKKGNINIKGRGLRENVYSNSPAMMPISFCHQRAVLSFVDFWLTVPSRLLSFPSERMPASPLATMGHFSVEAIQCLELARNSNFSAGGFATVVTWAWVRVVQAAQPLALVANRNPFECHTASPIGCNDKHKSKNKNKLFGKSSQMYTGNYNIDYVCEAFEY